MLAQLYPMLNELLLILLAGVVLSVSLVRREAREGATELWLASLGLAALLGLSLAGIPAPSSAFGGAYGVGPLEHLFKQIFLLAGLWVTLLSWPGKRQVDILPFNHTGEYLGLMLLSVTGMCFLVSAQELLLLYISLELVTVPLILLVAFNRQELRSVEAALKYVLYSALASGLLLNGLSFVYGLTGTTYLSGMAPQLTPNLLVLLALLLVMAGVGFKISSVPFHLWTPDTYEGAPVTVAAFLSVASKTAGFVLFYKLVAGLFVPFAESTQWLLGLLAAVTMTLGNLIALHQTNMKRFLAYSSIAQAGYLMIGLTNPEALGLTAVTYYLLVYLVSNLAAFGVVTVIASATGKEDMRDYLGLSETNPLLALIMMLAMFSLAGIPPLAGFLGKFYLFAAAAQQGHYWLVLVGAVNATLSLYYYLLVIKWMYLLKPGEGQQRIAVLPVSWASRLVLVTTSLAMILIGILPQIIRWVESATQRGF